ncbi:MAG TPA: HTTM domain-containing protein [Fimbriimonadaceae bacterium]|nr:HTTM domain-containing protein [Fimbriimonadaceae bacterium]
MATLPAGGVKAPSWLAETWRDIDRYWFATGSATTIGVFRILLGFANLANLLLILPFFDAWFTERGFTPMAVNDRYFGPIARDFYFFNQVYILKFQVPRIDVMANVTSTNVFLTFYIVLILCAFLTTLGLWTRVSSILLAIGVVTLQHRNAIILHGGDNVLRIGAIYMAIAPSGKACSLDRLIGLWRGRFKPGPVLISVWPQRVIAFNLALIYFTTWWVKMDGDRWRSGTATWFPAHLNEFHRFWVPPFLQSRLFVPVLTYGTLLTELALGTIVFWRPARKWVLLAGLLMHGYIEYAMNIPLFALSICSFYIAFYEGDEIARWATGVGQRLKRLWITVRVPKQVDLQSGPVTALRAVDVFGLVAYEAAKVDHLEADGVRDPVRAVWLRSPGAWPLGLVPGLWGRLARKALLPRTSS